MAANTIDLKPFLIESSAAAAEIVGEPPHLNIRIKAAVKLGLFWRPVEFRHPTTKNINDHQ